MITSDIANVILAFGTFVLTLVMVIIMLTDTKK